MLVKCNTVMSVFSNKLNNYQNIMFVFSLFDISIKPFFVILHFKVPKLLSHYLSCLSR